MQKKQTGDDMKIEDAEKLATPKKMFAMIRKTSKYYYQNDLAKERGEFPFPVDIITWGKVDYCVQGGPGGQYRLEDVHLYYGDDLSMVRLT